MGLPPVSSLASVLRDRGYEATAIHWYNGVYYNRYHNLRMLGFDSFFTLDTTVTPFEKKGMFVQRRGALPRHFASAFGNRRARLHLLPDHAKSWRL